MEDQKWHLSLERVLEVAIVAFQRAEIVDGEVSVRNGVIRDEIALPLRIAQELLKPRADVFEAGPPGERFDGGVGGREEGVRESSVGERGANDRKVGGGLGEPGEVGMCVDDLHEG